MNAPCNFGMAQAQKEAQRPRCGTIIAAPDTQSA
jgi:hypothetical protein